MASVVTTKRSPSNKLLGCALLLNAAAIVLYAVRSTYLVDAISAATQRNPAGRDLAGVADRIGFVELVCSLLATTLCLVALRFTASEWSSRWAVYLLIVSLIILLVPIVIVV